MRTRSARVLFASLLLSGAACQTARPQPASEPGSLERGDVDPELWSAMQRAKAELDAGHSLCAFARVEALRRSNNEAFETAFPPIFLHRPGFDPSPRGEQKLIDWLASHPADEPSVMRLADVYISRSSWAQAEPLLRKAMALQPDYVDPVLVLARVRSDQQDEAGAKQLMEAYLASHPNSALAILSAASQKEGKAQLDALEAARAKLPQDAQVLFTLAAAVQKSDDLVRAEELFRRAAELGPSDATIQAWTGRFFLKARNDPKSALVYYLRAYFLSPDFYETEFVEARIGRMISDADLESCAQ